MQVEEGKGSIEVRNSVSETLRALLHGGYVTDGGRDAIGRGILLHHQGGGPDLVLYPDGALHPVGVQQPLPAQVERVEAPAKPRRSFGRKILSLAKWAVVLAILTFFCALSITFWVAILDGM